MYERKSVLPRKGYSPLNKQKFFQKTAPSVASWKKAKRQLALHWPHGLWEKKASVSESLTASSLPTHTKTMEKQGQDKTRWDMRGLRLGEFFPDHVGVGLEHMVVPEAAALDPRGFAGLTLPCCWSFPSLYLRATSRTCQHGLSAPTHKNCSSEEWKKEPLVVERTLAPALFSATMTV